MRPNVLKRWADYKMRVTGLKQKYFTAIRKGVALEREKVAANFRRRLLKGTVITGVVATTYFFANKMYSEHLEIKKMKKKLMKLYPERTYVISFEEDPQNAMREVEVSNDEEDHGIRKIDNDHCIFISDKNPESLKLEEKLGKNIVVFSPKNIDELCHAIESCHRYRHSAIIGNYPINSHYGDNFSQLKESLQKIDEPVHKSKYIVIDLSLFKGVEIDEINDIVHAEVGMKCSELNKILEGRGFEPLFLDFCSDLSVHEIITNNLPLKDNETLNSRLQNLSLISSEGRRFKSSTEMKDFGQIPNLTSLFVGTGGVFAVPALANIRLNRKLEKKDEHCYKIQSDDLSELVIKWRQIRNHLSSRQNKFTLKKLTPNELVLITELPIELSEYIGFHKESKPTEVKDKADLIFSVDNKIVERLILEQCPFSINVKNSLLFIEDNQGKEQLQKLIANLGVSGGVLVWSKDKEQYKQIKERNDLTEAGAELMKKIVEIREGIDRRHVLESHDRYEKYFAKGFFRKITEFFW